MRPPARLDNKLLAQIQGQAAPRCWAAGNKTRCPCTCAGLKNIRATTSIDAHGEASRARLLRLLVKVRQPDRLASDTDRRHRGPARRRATGPNALPMRLPARLDNKVLAQIQGQAVPRCWAAGNRARRPCTCAGPINIRATAGTDAQRRAANPKALRPMSPHVWSMRVIPDCGLIYTSWGYKPHVLNGVHSGFDIYELWI
ncbi:hypothetical protein T492DRAFT_843446 [Pavlovales sp. CCMP2436]|nr:hypothetical protein T492DRAFT_843446 [Pavlovales sp. CCMP2436]